MERIGKIADVAVLSMSVLMAVIGVVSLLRL